MATEPGGLSDLGPEAQQDWNQTIAGYLEGNQSAAFLPTPTPETAELIAVDWGAYPVRVRACLQSRARANRLLDWTTVQGDIGRAELHEEYFEWRIARDATGKLTRVEVTTELPEYWLTLAAFHPADTLRLIARFAGEPSVPSQAVYGGVNPFAAGVTPAARRAGFADAMLPRGGTAPWSPYNNGHKAICFMSQGANTLGALIQLVAAAAFPFMTRDPDSGELRQLSGPEAIATGTQAAQACRNSDPTVVGATIGLCANGRRFALDDPIGIYIRSVDHGRLLQPDGSPVPADWFVFERGSRPHDGVGLERSQRTVFEVPPGLGFVVGDLIDSQTDQPIQFGGQIADLFQLNVYLRVGPAGAITLPPRELDLPTVPPCEEHPDCRAISRLWEVFEQSQQNLLRDTPRELVNRVGSPVLTP
jgi:hypothetical protein